MLERSKFELGPILGTVAGSATAQRRGNLGRPGGGGGGEHRDADIPLARV